MKPPTEADLILLENKVLRDWRDTSRSLEKIRLRRTLHEPATEASISRSCEG
jgi:hypothetical protein